MLKDEGIYHRIHQLKKEIFDLSTLNSVELIVVSKTRSVGEINDAIESGVNDFGENKIQEAFEKWPLLKQKNPQIKLHLIGGLQSNKVRKAIDLFDVIQTLDREDLARRMARICEEEGKRPEIYIQINVGNEAQKAGLAPQNLDEFYNYCVHDLRLNIVGLMALPPLGVSSQPYFSWMQDQKQRLGLPYLSMGMSGDYQEAIKMGATHVRIGQAIFGPRSLT